MSQLSRGYAGQVEVAWLALSDEEITRNLNEHAAKHDPKLDPGLAEAQFRTLLKHWEWEE